MHLSVPYFVTGFISTLKGSLRQLKAMANQSVSQNQDYSSSIYETSISNWLQSWYLYIHRGEGRGPFGQLFLATSKFKGL